MTQAQTKNQVMEGRIRALPPEFSPSPTTKEWERGGERVSLLTTLRDWRVQREPPLPSPPLHSHGGEGVGSLGIPAQCQDAPITGMGRPCCILLLCLAGLVLAGRAWGDSITLRPVADTTIFAAFPDNNLGSNSNLLSGANGSGAPGRALIRFDVAGQIPSGAVIQSSALTLNVIVVPGGGGVGSVYDLRAVQAGWEEGTGTGNFGSPANVGEATWNNRVHPSTPWTVPGGAISNDFSGTVSASMTISNLGAYTFVSTAGLVADVQRWLANPAANFGWVLISESEGTPFTARRFASREDTNNAPLLEIQFVAPPEIQGITAIGSGIQFNFLASSGQPYTVQYRDSLTSGDWLTLTNIAAQASTTNVVVVDPFPAKAQQFYRIGAF